MHYCRVVFEGLFANSGLSLERLRSFMQVAEAGSLIKAAEGNAVRPYRSRALVEAVREGRVDFALIREDALTEGQQHLKLTRLSFHLCVPKGLLPRGTTSAELRGPELWKPLPFAAGKDGGQLDLAIRNAMTKAGVDFRPRFECSSVLLVKQFIEQGMCAGILPSIGMKGMSAKAVLTVEFPPLANYGRSLVLHWNERQVRRRGVEMSVIKQLASALCPAYLPATRP